IWVITGYRCELISFTIASGGRHDDELALRQRRHIRHPVTQVLRRNRIVHLAELEHDILHGGNRQPFTGAPMRIGELAAALRNKLERRGFVLRKPFGLKGVRMGPDTPVMVRAIEVEYQPISRLTTDVLPLKIRAHPRADRMG